MNCGILVLKLLVLNFCSGSILVLKLLLLNFCFGIKGNLSNVHIMCAACSMPQSTKLQPRFRVQNFGEISAKFREIR